MKFTVKVNNIDLGETEVWQSPTELVQQALNKGLITQEDVNGLHEITAIDTGAEPPSTIMPRPVDPDNVLPQ